MKRPWQIWLLFGACVLSALSGMAWLTQQALRADQRRQVAESEAELEQRVSLALWRMDTELAPIIAEEVIRPPAAYRSAAKLAVDPPPYVLLQFEVSPEGKWSSPQAPVTQKTSSPKLEQLSTNVAYQWLLAALPNTPLPTVADANRDLIAGNMPAANANPEGQNQNQYFEVNAPNAPPQQQQNDVPTRGPGQLAGNKGSNGNPEADFQSRGKRYQSAMQQSLANSNRAMQSFDGANTSSIGTRTRGKPG